MKYIVTGPFCQFGVGQELKLSAAQIDARLHALDVLDDKGKVAVKSLVQFKKGEEINLAQKEEDLPSSLAAVLTPSSKSPKAEKPKKGKPGEPDLIDLDAIEDRLEKAEAAFKAALERHGISIAKEPTAEQRELIKLELDELQAAKRAYDEAIGEN